MKTIQIEKIAVNVVVEREKQDGKEMFIANQPGYKSVCRRENY